MSSNQEYMEKAVISAADTLATAGSLNTKQAEQFIDYVTDETALSEHVRVEKFRPESMEINKIGVGRRVAVPAAEARDPGVRVGAQTSKVTLTPRAIMVPFEITKDFVQYNVAKDKAQELLIKMMARALANNLEELYTNGNKLGHAVNPGDLPGGVDDPTRYVKDTYLALEDGFFLQAYAGGNRVDFQNQPVSTSLAKQALAQMPTKFKRRPQDLRLFYATGLDEELRHTLGARIGTVGDKAMFGAGEVPPVMGVRHIPVPLWDVNPLWVENIAMAGVGAHSLQMRNVTEFVGHPSNLYKVPTTSYADPADFVLNAANGTVTRDAGGAIADGANTKWTYKTTPQALLTVVKNMIVGIGLDISMEKDYDIYSRSHQYAIHAKVACVFEETDATVHIRNIANPA